VLESTEEIVRNGGIVLITFTLIGNFFLQLLEKLGKLPGAQKERSERAQNYEQIVCKYPGIGAFTRTMDEIREIREDGIRRAAHDDQVLKALQEVENNIRTHTQILLRLESRRK
jgi:hypothetical protein